MGRKVAWAAGVVAGLVLVAIAIVLSSWHSSSRGVASAFTKALQEHRSDDARALLDARLQQRVHDDGTVAPGEANDGLAMIFAAKNVDLDGVVQIGFAEPSRPYGCYDGTVDGGLKFWLVVRKNPTWKISDVRTTEPEACEGDAP